MRTTVDIETSLLERLRDEAHHRGMSFNEMLSVVIHRGLERQPTPRGRFRTPTFAMGDARPGVDLRKALRIADTLPKYVDERLHRSRAWMKVVDLNLLLYAVNRDAVQHTRARQWLDSLFSGDEPVALPWIVLLGFLRISTSPRVFNRPLTGEQAIAIVDAWLDQPIALSPGEAHWSILRGLLSESRGLGAATTDAHLAAMADRLHGAELAKLADGDFRSGSQACGGETDRRAMRRR